LGQPIVEIATPSVVGLRKARTTGIVGVITVIVAVFGYMREAVLAAHFGVSTTMDAYFGAIFIPNIVYFVLIAGTVSPVLIPILMQEDSGTDRAKASQTFSVVANFALLVLVVIVSLCLLGAHRWLPWLYPGFSPATVAMAVRLVYIIFPALLFLAMAGILAAVLNCSNRFALAAFAPALASTSVIAGVLFARGERAIYVVGIATAAGFLLQCLVLVPATASLGIRYRPVLNFRHPAIGKLLWLGIPLFLYLAVANISSVLERNLASRISAGAVSTLTYAVRLFTVPSNFLAAPLAIVAYPGFAREAARHQRGELDSQVYRIFRLVIFLFLPVTTWTIINALPMTRLLYEHGRFLAADSSLTAQVLSLYSIGILPNAIAIILLRCFFAIEDTVTPLLAETVALASFAATAPLISSRFGIAGLVATRAMTFVLVTAILIYVLSRRRGLLKLDGDLLKFLARVLAASAGMAAVSWLSLHLLRPAFDSGNTLLRLGVVGAVLMVSAAAYLGLARLLQLSEVKQILTTMVDLLPGRTKTFHG
jgi:putative peptidoglycan lipid II flippase